jgi:orotate phosphoribosyltransferase
LSESVGGRAALAGALFRVGAIRFGKSTLPSGKTTSYHLDLRVVPSDPEAYGLAVAACKALVESAGVQNVDAVAGIGVTGSALASPLAYLLKKPLLCLRAEQRGATPEWVVDGAPRPRLRTLVMSDEVGKGQGLASAIEALRKTGCIVKEAIALVDRHEGGKAALEANGVTLNSFVNIKGLATTLFENKAITKANYDAVLKQMEKGD